MSFLSRWRGALVALLALASTVPARAEITPEAKKVVDRYVAATGGAAAYENIRTQRANVTIAAMGMKGSTTSYTRRPDRVASEMALGPFKIKSGYDGTTAWRTDPASGKVLHLDSKDLEETKSSAYFELERWLDADQGGGKITLVGTEKDSTGEHAVVEIVPPVGRSRRVYFSTKTGLIDRIVSKRDTQTMTTTLSDYRQAGGRLTAFKTLTQIQGMPANDVLATVDSVAVNEEMADSRFAPPDASGGGVTYLKTPGTAKIPFRYSGRHVWITAAVNGGEAADFIFDTGASITVIDSAYAAKIGLQPEGQMQGQGAGAVGMASFGRLQSLRVNGADGDGVEMKDTRVAVLSINKELEPFFWRPCAGIIGFDVISQFVNEIDFDNQTLTLIDPKTFTYAGTGAKIPFTLAGTVPVIPMKLDGTYEGEFRVDVGSGSTVDLHRPFVEKNKLTAKAGHSVDVMGGGFGGMFKNSLTRMQKIEIGPYSWENPIVSFSYAQTGAFASEDYAGNIGNQILDRFKCTFDYERRALYLEPGKNYKEPDHFSRAGIQLARYGDTVKAMQVLEGSPADKAGLESNDVVVALDGKPTLGYTPDELSKLFETGEVGRKVKLEVERDGKKKKVEIKLKDML